VVNDGVGLVFGVSVMKVSRERKNLKLKEERRRRLFGEPVERRERERKKERK
jgi:hypothetical protein